MRSDGGTVITSAQLRAARALLGIDQRKLAGLVGVSVPTIQRMEASPHVIRGNVDSLMRLLRALDSAGIELIDEGTVSEAGGRGVRLKEPEQIAPTSRGVSESAGTGASAKDRS